MPGALQSALAPARVALCFILFSSYIQPVLWRIDYVSLRRYRQICLFGPIAWVLAGSAGFLLMGVLSKVGVQVKFAIIPALLLMILVAPLAVMSRNGRCPHCES